MVIGGGTSLPIVKVLLIDLGEGERERLLIVSGEFFRVSDRRDGDLLEALLIVLGDFLRVSSLAPGGSGAARAGTLRIVEEVSLPGEEDRSETDPRLIVGDFLTLTARRVLLFVETCGRGSSQTS